MQPQSDRNFFRRGAFPLILLLFVGVVVAVGGVYIVREQFLKEGKSGKTAYNESKIKEQIENPQKMPEITKEPKGELAAGPFVYEEGVVPSFSIIPPAGWEKFSPGGSTLAQFKSPEEDRVDQEDDLYVKSSPQITVAAQNMPGRTLEEIIPSVRKAIPAKYDKVSVVAERKTTYAGQDAYYFEVDLSSKGVTVHSVDYYFFSNGHLVHTGGTALKEFWGEREPAISGSLATFKLL